MTRNMFDNDIRLVQSIIENFECDYIDVKWERDSYNDEEKTWTIIIKMHDLNNGNMIARRCKLKELENNPMARTHWIYEIGKCMCDLMYRLGMNTK